MDGNAINRPEPLGRPRDAGGVVGTSLPGAHRAEEPQSPLTPVACCHLLQGPGGGGVGRDCWHGVWLLQVSTSVKTGYLVVLHDSRHMRFSVHKIHLFTGAARKMAAASSCQPLTSVEWTVGVAGEGEWAGQGARGSDSGGPAAPWLWAWAGTFSLSLLTGSQFPPL